MPTLPWRLLVRYSLLGTVVVVSVALLDLADDGGRNPVSLIQGGQAGPSVEVIEEDFPDVRLPPGLGHDGQQFYAVARAPMHLDEVSRQLDRPRYRLQRPLLPWLAWALQPTGGGTGLIWALFAVNVAAVFLAGLAGGALAVGWRGPPWAATVVALLPVGYVSLRISVADVLGLALVLCALLGDVHGRPALALLAATGAVLSKESILIVLIGWALTSRERLAVGMAVVAGAVAVAWAGLLRLLVDGDEQSIIEFGAPFRGLVEATEMWWRGGELWAAAAVVGALGAGLIALAARRRHPLVGAIALSALFIVPLNVDVVGFNLNGTRTAGPLAAAAAIALLSPRAGHRPDAVVSPS